MTNDQFTDEQRAEKWLLDQNGGKWRFDPLEWPTNEQPEETYMDIWKSEKAAFIAGMAAALPTWIPVTPETMPEPCTWYFVWVKERRMPFMAVWKDVGLGYKWYSPFDEVQLEITHYMPVVDLPAPPIK